jgi:ribosomal protein S18 acetylase RimI-like enzyme
MFGIESRSDDSTELRRMYLDRRHRGRGIAQRMLQRAETRAHELGFAKLILSTADVQKAAIAFYRKSGYALSEASVPHHLYKEGQRRADPLSLRKDAVGRYRVRFAMGHGLPSGPVRARPVHPR